MNFELINFNLGSYRYAEPLVNMRSLMNSNGKKKSMSTKPVSIKRDDYFATLLMKQIQMIYTNDRKSY